MTTTDTDTDAETATETDAGTDAAAAAAAARAFDAERARLRRIAHRILGSHWDAEDAVQETWLRLHRSDPRAVDDLPAWLTTVTVRVSVDLLRSRASKREVLDGELPDAPATGAAPEALAADRERLASAMLVVIDSLQPLERLAFVLHDVFAMPFEEVAPIVGRTPTATRQLASRARRRVRDVDVVVERERSARAVEAFLAAAREGDFGRLLQILDPEIELRADSAAIALAAPAAEQGAPLLRAHAAGPDAVARAFAGRAAQTRVAWVAGGPAAVYSVEGVVQTLFAFTLRDGLIRRIDVFAARRVLDDLTRR